MRETMLGGGGGSRWWDDVTREREGIGTPGMREGRSSSPSRGKRVQRGWRGNDGKEGGGRSRGCGRGSDLHKYIEFIEMSLGIAARRILAAYQPPRRFIPSSILPSPAVAADALLCCCSLLPLVVVLSRIY